MPRESKEKKKEKGKDEETRKEEKSNKPYLVMNMDKNARVGSNMVVIFAAPTYNAAKKFVDNMQGSSPEFVCILEQKAVFARQPKITVTEIDRDAVIG